MTGPRDLAPFARAAAFCFSDAMRISGSCYFAEGGEIGRGWTKLFVLCSKYCVPIGYRLGGCPPPEDRLSCTRLKGCRYETGNSGGIMNTNASCDDSARAARFGVESVLTSAGV